MTAGHDCVPSVDALIDSALREVDEGHLVAAINRLSDVIAIDPSDDLAWNLRARLKSKVGDFAGALSDISEAIMLSPGSIGHLARRSEIKCYDMRDYEGAISDCNLAMGIEPGNETLYFLRGHVKACMSDHLGAISDFSAAIKIDPSNPENWYDRGTTKIEIGDYEGAIFDLGMALGCDPSCDMYRIDLVDLWVDLARQKTDMGDYQGAKSCYEKALEVDPGNDEVRTEASRTTGRILRGRQRRSAVHKEQMLTFGDWLVRRWKKIGYESCPEHLQEAARTGNPNDLPAMLRPEWVAYCREHDHEERARRRKDPDLNAQVWEDHLYRLEKFGRSRWEGDMVFLGERGGLYRRGGTGRRDYL